MAKKINFQTIDEVKRAHSVLLDMHVEHVHVVYPANPEKDKPETQYIVVLNRLKNDAIVAFEAAGLSPKRMSNKRHYANVAEHHSYYQPKFDCKCRHCGKTFKSTVKEAVWCSKECHKQFRLEKKG